MFISLHSLAPKGFAPSQRFGATATTDLIAPRQETLELCRNGRRPAGSSCRDFPVGGSYVGIGSQNVFVEFFTLKVDELYQPLDLFLIWLCSWMRETGLGLSFLPLCRDLSMLQCWQKKQRCRLASFVRGFKNQQYCVPYSGYRVSCTSNIPPTRC